MSFCSNDNGDTDDGTFGTPPPLALSAAKHNKQSFAKPLTDGSTRAALHAGSHRRRHEDHAVAPHEQHGDGALGGLVDLLVRLLVNVHRGDRLLDVAENHVQVLVVRLPPAHGARQFSATLQAEYASKLRQKGCGRYHQTAQ